MEAASIVARIDGGGDFTGTGGALPGPAFTGSCVVCTGNVVSGPAHLDRGGGSKGTTVSVQGHGEPAGGGGGTPAFGIAAQRFTVAIAAAGLGGMAFPGSPALPDVPGNEPCNIMLVADCMLSNETVAKAEDTSEIRLTEPRMLREHVMNMLASVAVLPACSC